MQEALASHKEYLERLPRSEFVAVRNYLEMRVESADLKQALDATPGFPEEVELYARTPNAHSWRTDRVSIVSRNKPSLTWNEKVSGVRVCVLRARTGRCVESMSPVPYLREVLLSPGVFTLEGITEDKVFVRYVQDLVELTRGS